MPIDRFRAVPQTLEQWSKELNESVDELRALNYTMNDMVFRLGDTRQLWARKLNKVSAAVEAGPVAP